MSTLTRSACVAVLLLVVAATGAPAHAKGPTDVTVSGPGVEAAFDLASFTPHDGDIDIETLSGASGVVQHWDGSGLAASRPMRADRLGTRYVLTWTIGGTHWAVQHAYPFADGGAWVRFVSLPSGEPGGWVRAPALRAPLVALGAVEDSSTVADSSTVEPATAVAPPAGTDAAKPAADGSSYDAAGPLALAVAARLAVAGVVLLRRRRVSR